MTAEISLSPLSSLSARKPLPTLCSLFFHPCRMAARLASTKVPDGGKTSSESKGFAGLRWAFQAPESIELLLDPCVLLLLLFRLLLTAQGPPRGNIAATLLIIIINMIVFLSSINMACLQLGRDLVSGLVFLPPFVSGDFRRGTELSQLLSRTAETRHVKHTRHTC